jgi:hypothetical protein
MSVDHPPETDGPVPEFEDEYVDRVGDRLMCNYDLARDISSNGVRFDLYGRMRMRNQKHFIVPALSYAEHESEEHLFLRRVESVAPADVERLVDHGHALADTWIDADEEHYSTEFTYVLVVPSIPDGVAERVAEFRERTLLKYGFFGHYEINLAVVAPETERIVTSESADLRAALTTWEEIERSEPGVLDLVARRLQL